MTLQSRRAIWIVLDGVGLEALPDAREYSDEDAATLPHVAAACGGLNLPNMRNLGLGCLAEIEGVPPASEPAGVHGRLAETSSGKDSIIGHWELAGVVVNKPFATYPQGFPAELVRKFAEITGAEPLGNISAGGLSILKEYGAEHVRTGRPILYTSVDSVFQVAAHEDVLPPEKLYDLCRAVKPLTDEYGIARVIARPFDGDSQGGFRRTAGRKDFPVPPPQKTLLESLVDKGYMVSAVGKISDLFAGRGISRSVATIDNNDGMEKVIAGLAALETGLLMVNLIDFDMVYGHRNDALGFGRALEEFDAWLPQLFKLMRTEDLLVICADHGCDPTTPGSDHTREYVPVLLWSKAMKRGRALGDRQSFSDVAATLADFFRVPGTLAGESFERLLNLTRTVNS
ncbi:MAG: phosphopentomutase [Desulfuromonadales bacterium]|jgi:phosphopentomutase